MNNIRHLSITPDAVIDALVENRADIKAIYVCYVDSEEYSQVCASGDLKGLANAIMTLKNYWREIFTS